MIRSIVGTVLVAAVVSWLVSAGASAQAARQQVVSPDRTTSICAPVPGNRTLDWFCGQTPPDPHPA